MSSAMPVVEPGPDQHRPPPAGSAGPPLREEGLSDTDRNYAIAMHLTPLAGFAFFLLVFAPVALWLIRKDKSAFVDDHGREVVNLLLTTVVFSATVITGITVPFVLIWVVMMLVNLIRGAIAASNGEYFRYPMIIRFIS
ncbi:MAG: DUF4870 domain-containing protein [Planctomycetota bacterium]|nr:DUF4870 domain-containing protein [Planctomycetota bacterium]